MCAQSAIHRLASIAALALFTGLPAAAEPVVEGGRTIRVGPTRAVRTISLAAQQARDGDTVEIDAGKYSGDVAIWTQDRLTIRAVGGQARMIAAGQHAEGKAIWVVRGGRITIENIEFTDAKVPDKNGAGIRFEKGHLIVRNCLFENSENGLLSGGGDAQLEIEDSEFANNGTGDGLTHNLYVGAIKKLTVKGSYFHHARAGHLLKSRAAENFIINNRLTDEAGGTASYELEFPNGGMNYVIGNIIGQSATTGNAAIIAVGAEGYQWPRNELYLISNTIVDDRPQDGLFLSVKPGIGGLKGLNNVLIGNGSSDTATVGAFGKLKTGGWRDIARTAKTEVRELVRPEAQDKAPLLQGVFANNVNADWSRFAQPTRHDYRIRPGSTALNQFVDPGHANGVKLTPDAEYIYPRGTRKLSRVPALPGALQSPATRK